MSNPSDPKSERRDLFIERQHYAIQRRDATTGSALRIL
jgi:hypothetical protein